MSVKRWALLALIALVVFSVVVSAQDDDDEAPEGKADEGRKIREVSADSGDAEDPTDDADDDLDSKEETDTSGVKADTFFPAFADLKIPAGQRIELVIPVSNAAGNPTYEIAQINGHIATLDHSRNVQNFSAQVYRRAVEAGETVTLKYTVTPDAQIDPMEYAFVVVAFLRTDDNSSSLMVPAFNGTMVVGHPLGIDFKMISSVVIFFGSIGGAVYWIVNKRAANTKARAPRSAASPAAAETVEGTGKSKAYDPEFIDKSHLAYLQARRNRSASK